LSNFQIILRFVYVRDRFRPPANGMNNAFFGLIPNVGWANGDINFDNVIRR
jgi:hypothetical protein